MSSSAESPPATPRPFIPRSSDWGGKALLVFVLALVMSIPAAFVFALIKDRANRAESVVEEVSRLQGGAQQILGPVIAAPYTALDGDGKAQTAGWYVVSPETGAARVQVKTDTLRRGIFDVPVYSATVAIDARFAPPPESLNLPQGARIDWTRAVVALGFSDLRGAKADVAATIDTAAGRAVAPFAPAADVRLGEAGLAEDVARSLGDRRARPTDGFGLVSAPAAGLLAGGGTFHADLRFTGAQRLSVLPFAKSTHAEIAGDWSAPKFDGGFLPDKRAVQGGGFQATWNVPFMARGLADHAASDVLSLKALGQHDVGVTFVRTNNPYQNVIRALKYAVMFVGLVFLTFFVFEALSGVRLHPAQYVLIGLAQMVFYLLLLSLSEYVGFDIAFGVAAVATVLLIGLYAGAAFRARRYQVQALVIFSVVYGLIYLLMRLEDFALLAGSIASFIGLSAAMWLTRDIEWYGGKAPAQPPSSPA